MATKVKNLADKPLLFVDTNIFLNFYRAKGEAGLTLLERVQSVADSLIMTDQIEVEFAKNRENVLQETLRTIVAPAIPVPAYLDKSRVANAIEKHQERIRKQIDVLKNRLNRLFEDPARNDPVFKIVRRLTTNKHVQSVQRSLKFATEEIQK